MDLAPARLSPETRPRNTPGESAEEDWVMRIYDGRIRAAVALGRIIIGIIFLWAGLEKFIGTTGGFSAVGFLAHGTAGTLGWPFVGPDAQGPFNPTQGFWVDLSKNSGMMSVVNFLVVFGELGIGVSLILGLLTRFGAAMGTLMMLLFFVAAWDWAFGIVNQHLTYAVVTFGLAIVGAGNFFGLDAIVGPMVSSGFRRWFLSGDAEQPLAAAS
jgi:thiosulfate dehydrogenase (quinone) large subunit